jgi:hypothetical protein
MLGIRIPYLVHIPVWIHVVLLACRGYFIDEQRPRAPLEVVARLPFYLATSVGLTLLMCGLGPHS